MWLSLMFDIRLLNENDYDELLKWWKWFRFPAPAREFLPEQGKGGIMVSKDGVNICAGFIYFTNSSIAWIEFIVSNPEYKDSDRKEAIELLISELTEICRVKGYKVAFTSIKNENLINRFSSSGFIKASTNTTEMMKVI